VRVTSWPAPTGRPVSMHPRPDPWGVELRRREERRRRRGRRWRWAALFALAAAVVAGAAVAGTMWSSRDDASAPAAPVSTTAGDASVSTTTPSTVATTVPPGDLVSIDDVWLLDRDGDVYDWGVTVVVPEGGGERANVNVTVRVVDGDGVVVETASRTIDAISESNPAAVAGRVVDPASAPTRLEFDVSVGTPATDPGVAALLDVRAVTRDADVVSGRIRSFSSAEVANVSMVFVWRAEGSDEVVASVIYDVERVRPGVDARFEIDVAGEDLPDGEPDGVFLAP